jgi:hypothetical protein
MPLDQRAAQLQQLDDARAVWLAHTAGTRAAAEDAEALLAERHANDVEPEPVVTAAEYGSVPMSPRSPRTSARV